MYKQIHTCEWGWMGGKVDEEREREFYPGRKHFRF